MWDFICPVCQNDACVVAVGPKKSPILLVGDKPGSQEIKEGKPFAGPTGGVLRAELARVGVDLGALRLCNLWQHPDERPDGRTKKEWDVLRGKCLEHGAQQVLKEGANRKVILLMGSEPVKYFAGVSVEAYNGLCVPSQWFPHAKIVVCVQPAIVFHSGLGELRFALQHFADIIQQEKL